MLCRWKPCRIRLPLPMIGLMTSDGIDVVVNDSFPRIGDLVGDVLETFV